MNNENDNRILSEEDDVNFLDAIESSIRTIRNGQRIKGVVRAINGTEVQLDLGVKHAGFIPASEFENDEEPLKIGDEVDAFVVKVNDAEGTALLSKRNLDIAQGMEKIVKANEEGEIVKGKVHEVVKGGLVVIVNKIRVFVPASQASLRRDENLEDLAGKETKLRIIEVDGDKNGKRRRIIGSIKSVLKEEKQKAADTTWLTLAAGNKYEGVVKSITGFGAFVDIGGVDGLVHITELCWDKIVHPSQIVKIGDKVTVYVKDVNPETRKISLTMKSSDNDPWKKFSETIKVGDIIDSVVLKIMSYGAFASVTEGVDGLIHISHVAPRRVANVSEVLSEGQKVRVKVIGIDNETRKVSLSIRDAEDGETSPDSAEENESADDAGVSSAE